jgi:hypothetical protein
MTPERFQDRFEAYKGESQQVSGIWQLYADIRAGKKPEEILIEEAPWARTFSEKRPGANPLVRPYFWQSDNGPEGWRQCQTSSIAMELAGQGVRGIVDDLDYLRIVNRFGDTTVQETHRQALAFLKVKATFAKDWAPNTIKACIDRGVGYVAGILHHGPNTAATGGGHYVEVIGYTGIYYICHDPFGELDMVNGGWANRAKGAGKLIRYTQANFHRRWDVNGERWGWVIG